MNKLVKRGLKAYNIFLKNKIAGSLMMLIPGIMMTFAAVQGNGNDTKTLPLMILIAGAVFALWAFYRLGYIKAGIDSLKNSRKERPDWRGFWLQLGEAAIYVVITALGVFLLMNEQFTNKILNLMAGGFTTFNGVMGVVSTIKHRDNKDFRWKFVIVLTLFELVWGIYFLLASDSIGISSYLVMGIITTIAGILAVAAAFNEQTIKDTIEDGKEIAKTLKGEEDESAKQITEHSESE
ncbi:DUF308 domain-containing protein [Candidatus Saccharibacteria bacterium]|nr:DUF308 domain-containing protein [Candidatus Saccharibacteria bacterium]MBR3377714.1 DUF308 domain-containing protein [Candidatus Saccharibacteria bacterium]